MKIYYIGLKLISIILSFFFILIYIQGINISIFYPLFALFFFLCICLISPRFYLFSFIVKLMSLFYFAPFLPLYGYIFFDNYDWTWLPHQREAVTDHINLKIALIGAVGVMGIFGGMNISLNNHFIRNKFIYNKLEILTMSKFIVWSLIALFFSYLSAPANTIFEAAYFMGEGSKIVSISNFNAGYLVSYIILCFLYLDLEDDKSQNKYKKKYIWYFSFYFIIAFFQMLRGDREFVGLILGYILIKIYRPFRSPYNYGLELYKIKKEINKYVYYAFIFVFILLYIGVVRFSASEGSLLITGLFMNAPWTMTTLSFLAYFSVEKFSPLLYGSTYVDYFLSIIPTFVYSFFGIDSPSWSNNIASKLVETNLTSGGAHISLVALSNFGIIGVYFIMLTYSYLGSLIERKAVRLGGIYMPIWFGLIISVPFWFWYGEMAAVRGIMAAIIIFYLLKIRFTKVIK